jgi:hypothetical protein
MKPRTCLVSSLLGAGALLSLAPAFGQTKGPQYDEDQIVTNGIQTQSITVNRNNGRIPNRSFRLGVMEVPAANVPAQVDAKGGMVKSSKGVIAPAATRDRWEVFGSIYWSDEQVNQQIKYPGPWLVNPESDTETVGGHAGVRYAINDNWSVGGMVGYADANMDLKVLGIPFASFDIASWSLTPFVTFEKDALIAGGDFSATFQYTYSDTNYDLNNVIGTQVGSTDGTSSMLQLMTGLTWNSGAFHHGPIAGVRYIDGQVDAYRVGATLIRSFDYDSFATILGYEVSYDIALSGGKLTPYATVAWEHEFSGDYGTVAGVPNATIAEDTCVAGAGLGWYLNNGWNFVLGYEGRFNSESTTHYVGLKIGKSF